MTGILLAGGRSQRMGSDKALLELAGETFLARGVRLLRTLCQDVLIAARPGQDLPEIRGCRLVRDEAPDLGPLAGIAAGLAASGDDWHLVLACDLPLARPELLRLLCAKAGEADAVVPHAEGRLQPLLAVYSRACLEPAQAALRSGTRAIAAMLDRVEVRLVPEDELRAADPDLVSFINVNTHEDYQMILDRAAQDTQAL